MAIVSKIRVLGQKCQGVIVSKMRVLGQKMSRCDSFKNESARAKINRSRLFRV